MWDIKREPYFKWPRPMFTNSKTRNSELKCEYHKDHGHKTEECRTLKYFLDDLAKQGHLAKYLKAGEKAPTNYKRAEEKAPVIPANKQVVGVIDAIHGVTDKNEATKSYLRSRLTRAKLWSEAHPIKEVLSVLAPPKRSRESNLIYQLSFGEEDLEGVDVPHNDALVLTINIGNFDVKRVLIDPGSSSEVMYLKAYNQLRPHIAAKNIRSVDSPIYSFSGDAIWPICVMNVPVRVGVMVAVVEFFVMNIDSPYNAILGRNWLGEMKAVASPFHQKLKFPSPGGVVVVRGKQEDARFCFNLAVRGSLSERREVEEKEKVELGGPEQVVQVNLAEKLEKLLEEIKDQPESSHKGKGKEANA